MKIEYVASGLSFTRMHIVNENDYPHLVKRFSNWVSKLNERHRFGFLYNAFQESNFPNFLKHYNVPIYSDSGGLQMITKGIEITKEKKEEIFETQMKSDYAFCLDEVPIERIDKKRRVVLKDKFYEKGQDTGRNAKEQIEYFKKHNAKTKVFIIAQGQELEDYDNYIEGILSQLDKDDFNYVAGFAYSVACGGAGMFSALKAILASFRLNKHNIPEHIAKRIHYLGFGAINKFILIRDLSKHLGLDLDVSADCTTQTMGYVMGNYQGSDKKYTLRRYDSDYLKNDVKDLVIEKVFDDIKNFIKKYDLDIDEDEFKRIKKMWIKGTYIIVSQFSEQEKEDFLKASMLHFLVQVDNLMEIVDNNGLEYISKLDGNPYTLLTNVSTVEEMDKLLPKIVKRPTSIHPRISSEAQKKREKFNNLF